MRALPHTRNPSHELEIEPTWPKFMCNIPFSIHSFSVRFYFLFSPADNLCVFLSSFFFFLLMSTIASAISFQVYFAYIRVKTYNTYHNKHFFEFLYIKDAQFLLQSGFCLTLL